MNYLPLLKLAAPETIIALTALAVLAADLLGLSELEWSARARILTLLSVTGCLVAIGWMLALPQNASVLEGMFVLNRMREILKISLLTLTVFTVALSNSDEFTAHYGEYLALVLLAAIGLMLLVSSENILMIFVSLELTSLSLYILTAFQKQSVYSAEAALKYFLFGSTSAAFTLFGLSLLYGLSGATNLSQIASAISGPTLDPLLLLAIVMVSVGFGFKVAAAPFHLWAPDVYQGAPIPSAAFISSASKVAGFFVLARVMAAGFAGSEGAAGWHVFKPGWYPVIAVLSAVSVFFGNIAALAQKSVRRLLAYSAIAHAGYMLLGVLSANAEGLPSLVYYVITYGLATLGAFGVVSIVQTRTGQDGLEDFAGLSQRSPLASFCMLIFILSLAGIPPLAGFFGKFYVFTAALGFPGEGLHLVWLVALALIMSAVALYYYLQILKQIYVLPAIGSNERLHIPIMTGAVLALTAGLVILLGCAPNLLVSLLIKSNSIR